MRMSWARSCAKASVQSLLSAALVLAATHALAGDASPPSAAIPRQDGYVDAAGTMIYYESIGSGTPLVILHGGPGVPHGYFLPYLLPLARQHRLVFIDERGSGRSERLADPKGYTLDAMVADVEAVRVTLGLGRVDLLGHSFGGILAQAYATQHAARLRHLILAGTAASAADINADFKHIMESLTPQLRRRIQEAEARGIIGPDGAQLPAYRKLADEAENPYNYVVRPPAFDDTSDPFGWDVLKEMWGGRSDFHIDGNLAGFDFTPGCTSFRCPRWSSTAITT